jgi:uncharacterized membrane protein YhaH (DUF805 family)
MDGAKELARLLLSFRGVVSRSQFLAVMVILAGAILFVRILDQRSGLFALAFTSVCVWPHAAVSVKRLRALGRPVVLAALPWALFIAAWLLAGFALMALVFLIVLTMTPLLGGEPAELIGGVTARISILIHVAFVVWVAGGRHPKLAR